MQPPTAYQAIESSAQTDNRVPESQIRRLQVQVLARGIGSTMWRLVIYAASGIGIVADARPLVDQFLILRGTT